MPLTLSLSPPRGEGIASLVTRHNREFEDEEDYRVRVR